jgi:hypothetical protein
MRKIVVGVLYIIGGVTGYLVLRGTHSGTALVSIGCCVIIWGVLEQIAYSRHTETVSNLKEPPRMNESEAELWIARELGRLRMPDDLIAPVCEMTGLNWDDAKQLIRSVQDSDTIDKRRTALAMGYPIIAVGACLLVGTTFSLVNSITVTHNAKMVNPQVYCWFFAGLLMTVGGLYSMSRTNS